MQGRRVYIPEPDEEYPHPLPIDYQPGDYWFSPITKNWYCCCPNGDLGNLSKHDVIEYEDGTITVSPSILIKWIGENEGRNWHGYLENGIWREI